MVSMSDVWCIVPLAGGPDRGLVTYDCSRHEFLCVWSMIVEYCRQVVGASLSSYRMLVFSWTFLNEVPGPSVWCRRNFNSNDNILL